MEVELRPDARLALHALDPRERKAMLNAIGKIESAEGILGFPHTSRVFGVRRVWELRPRAGRSRSRAFFRVVRGTVVIAAIGPEAEVDPRGFQRAARVAERALDAMEGQR